jgi:tetratricopeptide (TPR) repeat protein
MLWALVLLLAVFAEPVFAQANFNPRNIKKIQQAVTAMEAGDPEQDAEAERILLSINLKRETPYGRARINQFLGRIATRKEEPDYEEALKYMEASVSEEDALEASEMRSTLYFVGQLQSMLERYKEAVTTLEKWLAMSKEAGSTPAPSSYYTIAVTYYQAEMPEKALEPARLAVENSDDPREGWYRLLLSLYIEREDYDNALAILDDVILKFPKKAYWQQMAAIYSQKDMQSKSLAVQQLAKMEGFIDSDKDLTRLAQMLMVEGLPHRGAEVMKKGLESGKIEPSEQAYSTYSNTLLQSREWKLAVDPLEKAAELKSDGSLFVRLAQVHLQLGEWGNARNALSRAFDKGGLNDPGQAHILFGISAANDKKFGAAEAAFGRAQRYEGTRATATKWIEYIKREKARLGIK